MQKLNNVIVNAENCAIMCAKDKCKQLRELLYVILTGNYPSVVLEKMCHIHLEGIVKRLVLYSRRVERYHDGAKQSRPRWWPKSLKFEDPITKLRPDVHHQELLFKWSSTLRDLVECCSRFHYGANQRLRRTVLDTKKLNTSHRASLKCYRYFRRFKCKENNRATSRKKGQVNDENKCEAKVLNKVPVLKLYNVLRQQRKIKRLSQFNLEPVVKLCDIKRDYKQKQHGIATTPQETNRARKCADNKVLEKAYVRLHDIFETPKLVECTKDDYMKYFNLGQTNQMSSLSMARHKPNHNKVFRNFNIPISSELGQIIVPTITDNNNALWRLQRLEWFLKENPQVKCEQEYPIAYTQRQDGNSWTHEYKFPKQRYSQMRHSPERYYKLGVCKPVCVKLERLDLRDPRYAKYLKKVRCRLSQRSKILRQSSQLNSGLQ